MFDIFGNIKTWAISAMVAISALVGIFFAGRSAGQKTSEEKARKELLAAMLKANKVKKESDQMTLAEIQAELERRLGK